MSRFRVIVITRILLLTVTLCLFSVFLIRPGFAMTTIALLVLSIYQVIRLINLVDSTNCHFELFLRSLSQSDYSISPLPPKLSESFKGLKDSYIDVLSDFKKSRSETEEKIRYLELVLMHARVGLIGFNQDGKIDICNNASKRYLQCNQLKTVHDLEKIDPILPTTFLDSQLKPNTIVKLEVEGDYLQLVLNASTIHYKNSTHTLVSFYNIQSNLEEKEMEAWHDLIRVLTHEIMNSITPIASLANTADSILNDESIPWSAETAGDIEKLRLAVETIHKRSLDLHQFVENYRKLSRLPNPDFEKGSVAELFRRVELLMEEQLNQFDVEFKLSISPENLTLICDSNMIEQLLINLVKNSIEATRDVANASIHISAWRSDIGQIVMEISDNGCGIDEDVISRVFIPFFTTKSNGSGIGLSLSRQMMRLHNGSIHVHSKPQGNTVFRLVF